MNTKENNSELNTTQKFAFRFVGWLAVFILLLATIPVLINMGHVKLAKTLGVVLIFTITIALMIWRKQTAARNHKKARIAITLNEKFWFRDNVAFYNKLNSENKQLFNDRIALFLSEVQIAEFGVNEPDKDHFLLLASNAIISTWGLPYFNFEKMDKVLLFENKNNDELQHLQSPDKGIITFQIERIKLALEGDDLELKILENFWIKFIADQAEDKTDNLDFWRDLKTMKNPQEKFDGLFASV